MTTFEAIDKLIKGESEVKVGVGVGLTTDALIQLSATLVAVAAIIMLMYFVVFKS